MAGSVFVQDGFSITDDITGVDGLYPTVRLTYRPCTDDEAADFNATPTAKAKAARAALVLSHLQGQSITIVDADADGKETLDVIPLRTELVGKLHAGLGAAILNRVLGYVGPSVATEKN